MKLSSRTYVEGKLFKTTSNKHWLGVTSDLLQHVECGQFLRSSSTSGARSNRISQLDNYHALD